MKFEKEITVEVDTDLQSLKQILKENNFSIKQEYDVNDIYMLNNNHQISQNYLETLKKCVLIRHVISKYRDAKMITYKYKEYNEKGEIIKQGMSDCKVYSVEEAQSLLELLGYSKLIDINDHLIVYANETTELAVQLVNNKHIYIEIEEKCRYIDRTYSNIEEMKDDIKKYNIPIKEDNFFAKKAEIELKEKLKNNTKF